MNPYDKNQAFDNLRQLGIVTVTIEFSGGNDEGGPDSVVALNAAGDEVDLSRSDAYEHGEWNPTTKSWKKVGWVMREGAGQRPATAAEIASAQLADCLEQPIYDEYGGFDGDFSVSGTLTWDVGAEKVTMTRSEQQWSDAEDVNF